MKRLKVLVIDDSAFNRRSIAEMLHDCPDIEVVGTAVDGEDGLKKAMKLKPDVITVDLEMPVMDGFTFIRMTMANQPTPCVVVSSKKDDVNVFKALDLGAVDFVAKPTSTISTKLYNIKDELIDKVIAASCTKLNNVKNIIDKFAYMDTKVKKKAPSHGASYSEFDFDNKHIEVVAIGSSTGGPTALKQLINKLPINLNVAVVVSQHMPQGFTSSFASRLNKCSGYVVKEAEEGDSLEKGKVLIAPGGKHLKFVRDDDKVYVRLKDGQVSDGNVPSVNVMFKALAGIYKSKLLAVVLTGMGADGKEGVISISDAGGRIIAESEKTAVVFGMPNEAIKTGKVDRVSPLGKISSAIEEICNQSKSKKH